MEKLNARRVGLTFAGSFLGAGYVSGQELWQFFGAFGRGGLVGILAPLGGASASAKASRRGVLLGTALLALIAYSVLLSVMGAPETADAELPMLALAYGLSRPLGYVYGVLLLLSMYGSAISMTVAITTYAAAKSETVRKRRSPFILALGACAFAGSLFGFGDLISVIYPLFGYCSSLFIVCLLVHAVQEKRKKTWKNREQIPPVLRLRNRTGETVTFCLRIVTKS